MKIIGLIGAKSAGKTTAFNFIKDKLPFAEEITLAKKLKDVCSEVFDIPRNYFDSHNFKEKIMDVPVYLDRLKLNKIYAGFAEYDPKYDIQVRPHLGVILDSPRKIAQYVGTEVLRKGQPDIHCEGAMRDFISKNPRVGIVTDMRFPNEFEWFKEKFSDFVPIYIKNTAAEHAASKDMHASEVHLRELSARAIPVANETTLENFRDNLYNTLKELGIL